MAVLGRALVLLALILSSADARRGKGRGEARGGKNKQTALPPHVTTDSYDAAGCKKCMTQILRLLVPVPKGCVEGNATVVASSVTTRVPTAFCEPLLPKKRKCVAYSFGVASLWDFDKALLGKACRVLAFDPFCCGAAHKIALEHDFVPVGLSTYDGVAESDEPAHVNVSFPVLSLKTIMDSYSHPRVDVLRMRLSTNAEWKVLKNLMSTGVLQDIRQLSLNLVMEDPEMWDEYKYILSGIRGAGFFPFYVAKQPSASYLKVQEGSMSLYSRYEVSYGNSFAR